MLVRDRSSTRASSRSTDTVQSFTRSGLTFEVSDDGPAGGRVVIALHGFPEDRHCWKPLTAGLTDGGYRVLAPDQRGYSPGARPAGRSAYRAPELAADVLALADEAGARRFDLVGHDWGAAVAWELAARHPDRVRSLTALSVPHTRAFLDAMVHSRQLLSSWYMLVFQLPALPELAMRRAGADRAAHMLERDGLDAGSAQRYAQTMVTPGEMTGRLNWYRAIPFAARNPLPAVHVPVLYVWGDGDHYVTPWAAERCGHYVEAPYRFEILPGASHWLPSAAPERVAPLLLDHLASVPTE